DERNPVHDRDGPAGWPVAERGGDAAGDIGVVAVGPIRPIGPIGPIGPIVGLFRTTAGGHRRRHETLAPSVIRQKPSPQARPSSPPLHLRGGEPRERLRFPSGPPSLARTRPHNDRSPT